MKIVVAIPTIEVRADAWQSMANEWRRRTCQPIEIVPSWRDGGWAQGLNEAWEAHPDADVFVCGSDDMHPEDDFWLPACEPFLEQNQIIAPQVLDPRFARWEPGQAEGEQTRMSTFPIIPKAVLPSVFPIADHEPQHYYADDLISDKARRSGGFETVAVPSCRIVHGMDERGRGAGMGSEAARMAFDRIVYERVVPR